MWGRHRTLTMIFICYRRGDSAGHTGRLFDRLAQHFGREQVFMDLDAIEPGEDFIETIRRRVSACVVQLVVIGPGWARSADAAGRRRLEDPDDYVRLEVLTALSREVRVIPVLVGNAAMPSVAELPEPLRPLVRRQAFELSDGSFHDGVTRLIAILDTPGGRTRETTSPPPDSAAANAARGADIECGVDVSLDESFDGVQREFAIGDGRRLQLAIPPGVETGSRLRLQGEGQRVTGGAAGDLFVAITVLDSRTFRRDGDDLHCTVEVPAASLRAGGLARTPKLGQRGAVKFAVPPRTQDGARLRLAGKGMPRLQSAGHGDLYVTVRSV